jgi:hypothetical protein
MKRLERWLAREKRKQRRIPPLEEALLYRRAWTYVVYRLRFVTLRVVLRTVLHLIEVVALSQVILPEFLGPILFLRHATLFLQGLWWGALEPQRTALREAHRKRNAILFGDLSSRWSAFACVVIVLEQALVGGWLLAAPRRFPGFSIYDAYAIACGLRLALETWSRTQHSAVFSVSRVRRPLWSLVLVDVFEVFGLLIAWLRIGALAFALVLAVSGVLRAAFTLLFARRTRRQLNLPERPRSVLREFRRNGWPRLPYPESGRFAALNASLQVESLAVMVLSTGAAGAFGLSLSLIIHALSPLFGAGYAWARVFYFDFKRLENYAAPLFAHRFARLLDRVAVVYPVALVMLVLPIANWLAPEMLIDLGWILMVLVVTRSIFALRQIEAYSYADQRAQLLQMVVLASLLGVLAMTVHDREVLFAGTTSAFLIAAMVPRRARIRPAPVEPGAVLGVESWLSWISLQGRRLRLVSVEVDRNTSTLGRVRRALIDQGVTVPFLRCGRAVWFLAMPADEDERALRVRLLRATAGAARKLVFGAGADGGVSGFVRELAAKESRQNSIDAAASIHDLIREFAHQFPEGVCLSASAGSLRKLPKLARRDLSHVLREALSGDRVESRSRAAFSAAAHRPCGELTHLFVVPRSAARFSEFPEFRRRLEAHCLHTTIATCFSAGAIH